MIIFRNGENKINFIIYENFNIGIKRKIYALARRQRNQEYFLIFMNVK